MNKTKERYELLSAGLNTYDSKCWTDALVQAFGNNANAFAYAVIAQFARMDGRKYQDFKHETHGVRNYENTCGITADLRNDQAIRKCSKLMDDTAFSFAAESSMADSGTSVIPYCCLFSDIMDNNGLTGLIRLCVTRLHKTLQQSLAVGCMNLLKSDGLLPDGLETELWMV